MIGTMTLNPCMDKTITIDGFHYGGLNRTNEVRVDASGKGINVSIALTQLGREVRSFGIEFENGSELFRKQLKEQGISYESILVPGNLRENIKIRNSRDRITTELNQRGDYLSPSHVKEFLEKLYQQIPKLDVLVITGSVPCGVETDVYASVIRYANCHGVKCILDAEGELLLRGIKEKPYLIKPNFFELVTAFHLEKKGMGELLKVCREILQSGVKVICLSMGEKGALILDQEEIYFCRPNTLDVKSTQGAGDSLVAGLCSAIEDGKELSQMLRYGVAAAQGSLIKPGTLLCTREDFEHFYPMIQIERIDEKSLEGLLDF
ncbi:1-phosphofructokinase family hexose kinase [Suipraeoptans intestinalis]|uniref:1-phosphofructokinase family hexose kinase n=1 Tax=Suipraeoptans intestinalis TaxID=2606628 RepID=UPI002A7548C2|nr:1-phosphofructokinase family hexose kinase [Suipraeoptans intestinalis]MDY3122661.1 1-phosphofructokinase family hexose kinase [Suipraeoptans intestinalis]